MSKISKIKKPNFELISVKNPTWIIKGVVDPHTGYVYPEVGLVNKLLPVRTQDEHAEHYRKEAKKDGFVSRDAPFHIALFTTLYENRENPEYGNGIEEIRHFLQESLNHEFLTTLTRIINNPEGLDKVIYNYGLPNEYYKKAIRKEKFY